MPSRFKFNGKSEILSAPSITCEQEVALIGDYVSGDLGSGALGTFEDHLKGCRDCAAFLRTYERTIEFTRMSLGMQAVTENWPRLPTRLPRGNGPKR
jgi:hypothetical protein